MFIGFSDKLDLFQHVDSKQKDCQEIDNDDYFVLIYGYPYLLGEDKYTWASPEDIIELYEKHSLSFVRHIDGVFTIFLRNKKARIVYIVTDCFGLYSPFFYKDKGMVYVFDKIEHILNHLVDFELNGHSLRSSLVTGYGFRFGSETHIKGVYSFKRGSIYTYTPDGKTGREIYWGGVESQNVRVDTFYKHLKEHFQKMMGLEGKKTFTVSGGHDTSTVLSTVLDQDFVLASFGMEKSNDIKSARKIANRFKKKLNPYILDDDFITSILQVAELYPNMFNGLSPHIHYVQFLWMVFTEKEKSDILYLGFLGDEIWRLCGMNINFHERFRNKDILDCFLDFKENDVYPLDYTTKASVLSFLIDSYGASFGSNLVKMLGRYMKVFMGLINKDILEKLNSNKISWDDRISGKIQKDFIKQNNKELYNILKKAKKVYPVKILTNRIFRKIFHKNLFKNYPNRPHMYDVWLREYFGNYIADLFIDRFDQTELSCLFKKEKLQEVVQRYLDGDSKFFEFVMTLLSIEIWLKYITERYDVIFE